MYILIFSVLAALALWAVVRSFVRNRPLMIYLGIVIAITALFLSWFLGFWGERLWFEQVGYSERFRRIWRTRAGLFLAAFAGGGLLTLLLTLPLKRDHGLFPLVAALVGALAGGFWWTGQWESVLMFSGRVSTGVTEPLLNRDTGFYLFTYPFLRAIYIHLFIISLLGLVTSLLAYRYRRVREDPRKATDRQRHLHYSVYLTLGIFFIVLGFGRFVARYGLLFSDFGVVSGPGWTDSEVRLPMLTVIAAFSVLGGAGLLLSAVKPGIEALWRADDRPGERGYLLTISGIFAGVWIVFLGVIPALFQWLRVNPGELASERPYLEHSIRFTRAGFQIDRVKSPESPMLFNHVKLLDDQAMKDSFNQMEQISPYHQFDDVDIDRYMRQGELQLMMIAARELNTAKLPREERTYENLHLKYTHGFGAVLFPVNGHDSQAETGIQAKNQPPDNPVQPGEISRPEIYYGEQTGHYVLVHTDLEEFDFSADDRNVTSRYRGSGGVEISHPWRKFIFGYRYGGTRLLASGHLTDESRLMLHRDIMERVRRIAPFLRFSLDPYPVVAGGRLYWMIDAFTVSGHYPYSKHFEQSSKRTVDRGESLTGSGEVNYIRNSIKVTVDAYNGDVNFYLFEKEDPLIQAWGGVFPDMFKPREQMPGELERHIRYPAGMLEMQAEVYARFHTTDPELFYNGGEPREPAGDHVRKLGPEAGPGYKVWQPRGSEKAEFVLVMPCIRSDTMQPDTRSDTIQPAGWLAARCDSSAYGQLLFIENQQHED